MPTSCLENGFACGTVIPIWMNGLEKISIYSLSYIIDKYIPVVLLRLCLFHTMFLLYSTLMYLSRRHMSFRSEQFDNICKSKYSIIIHDTIQLITFNEVNTRIDQPMEHDIH